MGQSNTSGSSHASSLAVPFIQIDPTTNAQLIQTHPNYQVYRNSRGQQYEKYIVSKQVQASMRKKFNQAKSLAIQNNESNNSNKQKQKHTIKTTFQQNYQYRLTHRSKDLVQLLYAAPKQQSFGNCNFNDDVKYEVVTQRIMYRLEQLYSLEFPIALEILKVSLRGFKNLYTYNGMLWIKGTMIGLNMNNEVKVWLNSNFALNYIEPLPFSVLGLGAQQQQNIIVNNLIDMISSKTRPVKEWNQLMRLRINVLQGQANSVRKNYISRVNSQGNSPKNPTTPTTRTETRKMSFNLALYIVDIIEKKYIISNQQQSNRQSNDTRCLDNSNGLNSNLNSNRQLCKIKSYTLLQDIQHHHSAQQHHNGHLLQQFVGNDGKRRVRWADNLQDHSMGRQLNTSHRHQPSSDVNNVGQIPPSVHSLKKRRIIDQSQFQNNIYSTIQEQFLDQKQQSQSQRAKRALQYNKFTTKTKRHSIINHNHNHNLNLNPNNNTNPAHFEIIGYNTNYANNTVIQQINNSGSNKHYNPNHPNHPNHHYNPNNHYNPFNPFNHDNHDNNRRDNNLSTITFNSPLNHNYNGSPINKIKQPQNISIDNINNANNVNNNAHNLNNQNNTNNANNNPKQKAIQQQQHMYTQLKQLQKQQLKKQVNDASDDNNVNDVNNSNNINSNNNKINNNKQQYYQQINNNSNINYVYNSSLVDNINSNAGRHINANTHNNDHSDNSRRIIINHHPHSHHPHHQQPNLVFNNTPIYRYHNPDGTRSGNSFIQRKVVRQLTQQQRQKLFDSQNNKNPNPNNNCSVNNSQQLSNNNALTNRTEIGNINQSIKKDQASSQFPQKKIITQAGLIEQQSVLSGGIKSQGNEETTLAIESPTHVTQPLLGKLPNILPDSQSQSYIPSLAIKPPITLQQLPGSEINSKQLNPLIMSIKINLCKTPDSSFVQQQPEDHQNIQQKEENICQQLQSNDGQQILNCEQLENNQNLENQNNNENQITASNQNNIEFIRRSSKKSNLSRKSKREFLEDLSSVNQQERKENSKYQLNKYQQTQRQSQKKHQQNQSERQIEKLLKRTISIEQPKTNLNSYEVRQRPSNPYYNDEKVLISTVPKVKYAKKQQFIQAKISKSQKVITYKDLRNLLRLVTTTNQESNDENCESYKNYENYDKN